MCKITEKDKQLFIEMLNKDKNSLHFLWDCTAGTIATAGSAMFDNVTGDPLDYLRESGLIDENRTPNWSFADSSHTSYGTRAEGSSQSTELSAPTPRKRSSARRYFGNFPQTALRRFSARR